MRIIAAALFAVVMIGIALNMHHVVYDLGIIPGLLLIAGMIWLLFMIENRDRRIRHQGFERFRDGG